MPNILITGAYGFLGYHVLSEFLDNGYINILSPHREALNLLHVGAMEDYCAEHNVSSVIHLAAVCGGIGANAASPGRFIHDNLVMGVNVLEAARKLKMNKVVLLSTVCAYPKMANIPFKEDEMWDGYPEETNAPYGIAKKTLMVMGNAYRAEYGLNVITLLPVNMAGEHDHFNEDVSHVIPALVVKMETARLAGDTEVVLWGDGSPSREFLYAGDAARAIRMAFESYDGDLPINIGTGKEVTIRELAEKVAQTVGYTGSIRWDKSQPNGQPRRCLDVSRAKELLNFEALVDLDEMLYRTVQYYREQIND